MKKFPYTLIGLIEELEVLYPQKCIQPQDTREEADHYAGRAALVVELRARYEADGKREKNALPKVLKS